MVSCRGIGNLKLLISFLTLLAVCCSGTRWQRFPFLFYRVLSFLEVRRCITLLFCILWGNCNYVKRSVEERNGSSVKHNKHEENVLVMGLCIVYNLQVKHCWVQQSKLLVPNIYLKRNEVTRTAFLRNSQILNYGVVIFVWYFRNAFVR